jgi:hypothetical protein
MTGFAKRMVRSGIALLNRRHGKRNLAFLTVTIPDLPWEELEQVCQGWAELARRLMEEIGRELERAGLNPEYVYVNELQEERWRNDGIPAPHIHAIFQGRKLGDCSWGISKEKFRELWERILGNFLGREISLPAATRVEVIKKCAKRYMTKYMSKGDSVVGSICQAGLRHLLPGSWWGMSNSLRRQVKQGIIEVTKDTAEMIADHISGYRAAGIVRWFCRIWLLEDEYSWTVYPQLNDEPIEGDYQFKRLLSVSGEFKNRAAMMSFITDS